MENITVEVAISRNSKDEIGLKFIDKTSRVAFLEVRMSPEQFAMAITGLGGMECQAEVRDLQVVGKKKIYESRSIECPLETYSKEELKKWLIENACEEGWEINSYLGSQSSIVRRGDKIVLNYGVYRYE